MAQELELSHYSTVHELKGSETNSADTGQSGRRLVRIGILTLAVLCILQATINISLRLAFHSKEETDQFPFNISIIGDVCQDDLSHHNSTHLCSCCNNLLRRLLRKYQVLEKERDFLYNKVIQLTRDREDGYYLGSGSGALEDFLDSGD